MRSYFSASPKMTNSVLQAVEASDENIASEQFQKELGKDVQAWEIHLSLFF